MNRFFTPALTSLCAALCLAGAANAQSAGYDSGTSGSGTSATGTSPGGNTAGAQRGAASALARADRDFLEKAAHANFAEIEASKLAQSKATSAEVKQFAQQMIDDHTKASQELRQLAESKGVKLPDGPAMAQKAKSKMLAARDGEAFDREYAQEIGVKAHRDTVQLFQKAAQNAQDSEVKAFAQKMLPRLQHHLQMAEGVHKAAMARSGGSGTTSGSGTSGGTGSGKSGGSGMSDTTRGSGTGSGK